MSLRGRRAVLVECLGQRLSDPRRALILDLSPLEHIDQLAIAQDRD
jgi:hypothetical protein